MSDSNASWKESLQRAEENSRARKQQIEPGEFKRESEGNHSRQGILPFTSEVTVATPNSFIRCALFGARRRGRRPYVERKQIYAQAGISLIYTGALLDQKDLDNWFVILQECVGVEVQTSAYKLLKILGISDGYKNYMTLDRGLSRLKATALILQMKNISYEGSLIDEVYRDSETKEYRIKLNPKLKKLFEKDNFTLLDLKIRRELEGKPLAQWLHAYYSSHASPYPVTIEKIHDLCGSDSRLMSDFKKNLMRSLIDLQKASEKHDKVFKFSIQSGMVSVKKTSSKSQSKHILRKVGAA